MSSSSVDQNTCCAYLVLKSGALLNERKFLGPWIEFGLSPLRRRPTTSLKLNDFPIAIENRPHHPFGSIRFNVVRKCRQYRCSHPRHSSPRTCEREKLQQNLYHQLSLTIPRISKTNALRKFSIPNGALVVWLLELDATNIIITFLPSAIRLLPMHAPVSQKFCSLSRSPKPVDQSIIRLILLFKLQPLVWY